MSELIGNVFSTLGARHVIYISKDYKVKDDVAILFAKIFYKNLFTLWYNTICDIFT